MLMSIEERRRRRTDQPQVQPDTLVTTVTVDEGKVGEDEEGGRKANTGEPGPYFPDFLSQDLPRV